MQTQDLSFDKKTRRLLREEKKAMARLKDIIHKYRLLMPFISNGYERLERKIAALSANCDESEKILSQLKPKIRVAQKNKTKMEKDIRAIEAKRNGMITSYDALLMGAAPVRKFRISPENSILELKKEKEHFLETISDSFKSIEEEMNQLDTQRAELTAKKNALEKHIAGKKKKEAILEKKVELYRTDIRNRLKELNAHVEDKTKFTRQYSRLIATLKKAPDISGWQSGMIKEAIQHSRPKARFIELTAPTRGGSR